MSNITQKEIIDLLKKILPTATESDRSVVISIMGVSTEILKPDQLDTKVRRSAILRLR